MDDMDKRYTVNEEQVLQILHTECAEIKKPNVKYDIFLPRAERIENAKKILTSWGAKT